MFSNILVAIDPAHTERAEALIGQAKLAAGAGAGSVTLISVLAQLPSYVSVELPRGFDEKAMERTAASLHALAAKSDVPEAHVIVAHGAAHREILAYAGENGNDLIIIGSHKPGFEDYLLGSTAAKVVRHAKCAVLIIR